jgi:hypothetical protein
MRGVVGGNYLKEKSFQKEDERKVMEVMIKGCGCSYWNWCGCGSNQS